MRLSQSWKARGSENSAAEKAQSLLLAASSCCFVALPDWTTEGAAADSELARRTVLAGARVPRLAVLRRRWVRSRTTAKKATLRMARNMFHI